MGDLLSLIPDLRSVVHSVYLDFNGTTPLAPSVLEAMSPFWTEHFMLPGQGHRGSQAVADALEQARESVATLVGCEPFEIIFTSGATEANNLAILGTARRFEPGHVLVSPLEHDSVWLTAESLRKSGWRVGELRVESRGVVSPDEVERQLCSDTRLVCLQAANPTLGTIQPVRQVADLCHSRGVQVHCDAVQMVGKLPLRLDELRADTASISGHKMYGPKGVGALYVRRGLELFPNQFGEVREMGLRVGTENPAGWIGLGAAARLVQHDPDGVTERLGQMRDTLVDRLREQMDPPPRDLACGVARLPNTVTLQLPQPAERVLKIARQLAVARPHGCDPADEMTRALRATGLSDSDISQCCRISVGLTTSLEQCERSADLLAEACDIVTTI